MPVPPILILSPHLVILRVMVPAEVVAPVQTLPNLCRWWDLLIRQMIILVGIPTTAVLFVMSNTSVNFIKASSCSGSASSGNTRASAFFSGPGSCETSSGGSAFHVPFFNPRVGTAGGKTNSCSSNSFGKTFNSNDTTTSGSIVSSISLGM